jgi:hypothetical protein
MRSNEHVDRLSESLLKSKLDSSVLIPFVEEFICIENNNLEANKLLNNIPAYLSSEYRVSHFQILLCLLRRHANGF